MFHVHNNALQMQEGIVLFERFFYMFKESCNFQFLRTISFTVFASDACGCRIELFDRFSIDRFHFPQLIRITFVIVIHGEITWNRNVHWTVRRAIVTSCTGDCYVGTNNFSFLLKCGCLLFIDRIKITHVVMYLTRH